MPARSPHAQLTSLAMPTQNVTDLDALQAEIERKRRLADLLQSQSFKGMQLASPNAPASILNALAPVLQAYMGQREKEGLGKQEQELAAKRSEQLSMLLKEMPQGTTQPGQPAIAPQEAMPERQGMPAPAAPAPVMPQQQPFGPEAGANPLAQALLGGAPPGAGGPPPLQSLDELTNPAGAQAPMLPAKPAVPGQAATPDKMVPAAPQDMMQWAAKLAAQGGPAGQHIAGQVIPAAIKNLVPDQERQAQQEADRALRADALAQQGELRRADLEARAEAARQRSEDTRLSIEQRRQAAAESTAARREIAGMIQETKREKSGKFNATPAGASEAGNPVLQTPQGTMHEVINGVPSPAPYTGPITDRASQVKNVADVTKGGQSLKEMDAIIESVDKNPSTYGVRAAIGSMLPGIGDIGMKVGGLTQEQATARARAASYTANVTHSLYGSAFTTGEQARAKDFLITPKDGPETIKSKIAGRKALEKEHLDALPQSAKNAAAARSGGGRGGSGGWGKAEKD
jgi:hypothetical protein